MDHFSSKDHYDLFHEVTQPKNVQRGDGGGNAFEQGWEDVYEKAHRHWMEEKASAAPYDSLRTIRASLKGDGNLSSGNLWTRHILVRCLLLETREPHVGEKQTHVREKQIGLLEEALRYCKELKIEYPNAKDCLVSKGEIYKMEKLTLLEKQVFESQPHQSHRSGLDKLKGKALHIFGRA
ncbi:MAG: hypothetical protein Q9223_007805 [Gallowayella weberi]